MALLGIVICPLAIPSVVAILLGISARRKIRDSDGALGGEGLALAGIILGGAGIAWSFMVVAIFALPFMLGV